MPMVGAVWPVMSSTSRAEASWSEPLSMKVVVSIVGQIEGGTPEESFVDVAIGQASVSVSPTPSIARGAALEELLL